MNYTVIEPLITEKTTNYGGEGFYAFQVELGATKMDVKKAVEKFFGVKVRSVNTVTARKTSKKNKYGESNVKLFKKAYVKVAAGQKIALFEGV